MKPMKLQGAGISPSWSLRLASSSWCKEMVSWNLCPNRATRQLRFAPSFGSRVAVLRKVCVFFFKVFATTVANININIFCTRRISTGLVPISSELAEHRLDSCSKAARRWRSGPSRWGWAISSYHLGTSYSRWPLHPTRSLHDFYCFFQTVNGQSCEDLWRLVGLHNYMN